MRGESIGAGEGLSIDSPQSLSEPFSSGPHCLDSRTGRAAPTIIRDHGLCVAGLLSFRDSAPQKNAIEIS
jgi:hypothetical protein